MVSNQSQGFILRYKGNNCAIADDSPIIFVKGCKHMHGGKPPFTYFVDGKHKGELMADSNDTVPIGFDIGTKATWNGEKWDVSKK